MLFLKYIFLFFPIYSKNLILPMHLKNIYIEISSKTHISMYAIVTNHYHFIFVTQIKCIVTHHSTFFYRRYMTGLPFLMHFSYLYISTHSMGPLEPWNKEK